MFAVSATGREANETHTFIKEILKSVISTYGTDRLETSVIVYGELASTEIMFGDIFQTDAALITAVSDIPRMSGVPSLEKALEEAEEQFKSPFIRPKAAKVCDCCILFAQQHIEATYSSGQIVGLSPRGLFEVNGANHTNRVNKLDFLAQP